MCIRKHYTICFFIYCKRLESNQRTRSYLYLTS
uniref:Uncharacterized protein n=1 Tax=Ackermannviridae sp. ctaCq7 TaxID=2827294 RepID=A0A8S5R6K4_9CAUD|nr:MAG TPA: hypothetical protein [Ackermannviridae sp. ctaCq7]